MGIIEITNTIRENESKLATLYNSSVDLLQQNIYNNNLFEEQYKQLKHQTQTLDDQHILLKNFDNQQKSQILNLQKHNEKSDERLVKQPRRIFLGIALCFILFIAFSKRQSLAYFLSAVDKRITASIILVVLILSYRSRYYIIESFSPTSCDSKKQIDIIRSLDSENFKALAHDLLLTEKTLQTLKDPPTIFSTYSDVSKSFNVHGSGFNLSC